MNNIIVAYRRSLAFIGAKGNNLPTKFGIRYENKVDAQLRIIAARERLKLERSPWFNYTSESSGGLCAPDFILGGDGIAIVIEVKLTYVPEADTKLGALYVPIAKYIFGKDTKVRPLIIAKTVTPACRFRLVETIRDADTPTFNQIPVLSWLGRGAIPW